MNTQLEIQTTGGTELVRPQPTVADMMQAAIQGGVTESNVAVIERLASLYERMEARRAEQDFAAAFVRLQAELPTIAGGREVTNRDGSARFQYANFEDIDAIVRPLCLKHGFTYSFRETAYGEGRITTTMTLTHAGGHSREIAHTVRIGGGAPGNTDPQNDNGAHTYGRRGALENGLSLRIVGKRELPSTENLSPLAPELADELERRVALTNSDRAAFLKFAGAKTFAEIPASKYDVLDQHLRRKEKGLK